MCYKWPGPRCSSYASKKLADKSERQDSAKRDLDDARKQYDELTNDIRNLDTLEGQNDWRLSSRRLQDASDYYDKTRSEYYAARDELDETVTEQDRLEEISKDPDADMSERIDAQQRLRSGIVRRERKLDNYKAVQGITGEINRDDDTHFPDDDATNYPNTKFTSAVLAKNPSTPIYYHGSQVSAHGECELMEIESTDGQGRYTLRTKGGQLLQHVRGGSMSLLKKS